MAAHETELSAVEAELATWAVAPPLAGAVASLGAYRGITQLTGMTLAAEVVDSVTLATTSFDQTVRLWEVKVDEATRRICTITRNNLTPVFTEFDDTPSVISVKTGLGAPDQPECDFSKIVS